MLTWALVVFAVAAVGGLVMAVGHFQGRSPPAVGLAVGHGVLAATGLVLLLVAVFGEQAAAFAQWALGLFLLAAAGGFVMALGFHARKRALPSGLVAGHALLAVTAFVVLLAGALGLF